MTVAVDTNILFDILLPDPEYRDSSIELLIYYSQKHRLLISEIVYSELASQFNDIDVLKSFLNDSNLILETTGTEGLWIAAKSWNKYTNSRGEKMQCSKCGAEKELICDNCNNIISSRQHIISDFIIGGHAEEKAELLLTRDRGFYRNYFENLKLISKIEDVR